MQGRVVVSFARTGRSESQSFPRKRESTLQAIGNAPPTDWIPACAGMTSVSKSIPFQMTPGPPLSEHLNLPAIDGILMQVKGPAERRQAWASTPDSAA